MTGLVTDKVLLEALQRSAKRGLSADEVRTQRISFIMGSLSDESTVTKEQISRVLAAQEGVAAAR